MDKIYKVWQVNAYIKMCLESEDILHNIFIEGEISNFKHHSSGHMYFSLKDSKSSIRCVCFKSYAQNIKFAPGPGMKVIIQGNISAYEKEGVYQVYVSNITPKGEGEIALALDQLKEKLAAEGLFDHNRKKPIPSFAKKIGVLSAETGAVIRDICFVASKRNPQVEIILYPTLVQGEKAAKSMVEGIKFFNSKYPVDVLILARGGGSKEDLWCFNDEELVRAVAASKLPIITAVGHETDTTLVDYASDLRAATPSQAAEFAVYSRAEALAYCTSLQDRLNNLYAGHLKEKSQALAIILKNSMLEDPEAYFKTRFENLALKGNILEQSFNYNFKTRGRELALLAAKLELFNPLNILKRGYVIASQGKKEITRLAQIDKSKNINLEFYDGKCQAKLVDMEEGK